MKRILLIVLVLFSVAFPNSLQTFAYSADYPVAESPSIFKEIVGYVRGGITSLGGIYIDTGASILSTYKNITLSALEEKKYQEASLAASLRQALLDFLGFTEEEPAPTPTPTPTPTTTSSIYVPPGFNSPTYITNNYYSTNNTYPTTTIRSRGGSTSGLARSVSRTNSEQETAITALGLRIDALPTAVSSQWTTSGSDIYYSTGNVGISTSTPSKLLTIGNNASVDSSGNILASTIDLAGGLAVIAESTVNADYATISLQGSEGASGVGTITATDPLVDGNIYFNNLAAAGTFQFYASDFGLNLAELSPTGLLLYGTTGLTTNRVVVSAGTAGLPTLSFSDDDTGLYYPTTNSIGFSTGGTERLRITSAGNVGIGTTSPSEKLDVRGNIRVQTNGSNEGLYGKDSSGTYLYSLTRQSTILNEGLAISSYGSIGFAPQNSVAAISTNYKMIINGDGNVGIGTTTPSTKLAVQGDILWGNEARTGDWIGFSGYNAISLSGLWDGVNENIMAGGPASGDPNLYFNVPAGGIYYFSEDGIGGGSTATLSTTQGIQVTDGTALAPTHTFMTYGDTGMFLPAAQSLGFSTAGTERLRISASGNVGIGTSSPYSNFHIYENNTSEVATELVTLSNPSGNATNNGTSIGFYQNAGGNQYGRIRSYYSAATDWVFALGSRNADHIVIDGNGDVGIGTATPAEQLHIKSGAYATPIALFESGGDWSVDGKAIKMYVEDQGSFPALRFEGGLNDTFFTVGNKSFGAYGVGGSTFSMTNFNNGRGSQMALIANQSTASTDVGQITFTNATSTNYITTGNRAGAIIAGFNEDTSYNKMALRFLTNASALSSYPSERMRITSAGYVGINMTDPSVALDVTGDIEYTGSLTDVSDARLKENISDFGSGLAIINAIGVKNYNMISSPGRNETGFIAQNIQDVFPQAVSIVDPINGYMGVSYISFIPVLTKGMQELDLKFNSLLDIATSTLVDESFKESFWSAVFSQVSTWLADATNGISSIFTDKLETKELCVADQVGSKTCITKEQLDTLLQNAGGAVGTSTPPVDPDNGNEEEEEEVEENTDPNTNVGTSTPPVVDPIDPIDPIVVDPVVEPEPEPEVEPVPEPEPEPEQAPESGTLE